MTKGRSTIAIAWLRREDWPRWAAIDPHLPPSYERWLAKITRAIAKIERTGVIANKVVVEPGAFAEWCRDNGKPIHSTT